MKRTIALLLLLAGVAPLTGCVALDGPTYAEFEPREPPIATGMGRIVFFSPGTDTPIKSPEVELDGEVVGGLPLGGFFFVDRDPGSHEVQMKPGLFDPRLTIRVDLEEGRREYVRFTAVMGEGMRLEVVPDRVGKAGVQACVYVGDEAVLLSAGSSDGDA